MGEGVILDDVVSVAAGVGGVSAIDGVDTAVAAVFRLHDG